MIIDFFLNSHYPSLSEREKSESEAKPADPTTTTAKTADKKASESIGAALAPAAKPVLSSLSFGAASGDKPSLFGGLTSAPSFSFGGTSGNTGGSSTPVKSSFSFNANPNTPAPVVEAAAKATEARKEQIAPTSEEAKKSEQQTADPAKSDGGKKSEKPNLLFGQTTGTSLFGNKTNATSLFGVRMVYFGKCQMFVGKIWIFVRFRTIVLVV